MITPQLIAALAPKLTPARAAELATGLQAAAQAAQINTPARAAAFLAQLAHESCAFRYCEEIWGPTPAQQRYEGRADLGNLQKGDGYRFRGRGWIQLTGRHNYRKFGGKLGLDLEGNPDLAAHPDVAAQLAAAYWTDRGLNAYADAGNFREITRRINGGFNGLDDRERYHRLAQAHFAAHPGTSTVFMQDGGGNNVLWDGKPTVYAGQTVNAAWVSQMALVYPPGTKTVLGRLSLEVYPDGALQLRRA